MADPKTDFTTNIPTRLEANKDTVKGIGAVFLFTIDGPNGGTWTVNCKDDVGVKEGDAGGADCTIKMAEADWNTLRSTPGAGMQLFMSGKLKVGGNMMLATKLQQILGS